MAIKIKEELKEILADEDTIKVIASVDLEGKPHVVVKGSISLNENNQIRYLEFLENSRTNKNLLASLWFDKTLAITVLSKDRRSFQIKGRPIRTSIAGREFEEEYKKAQERHPDNDLSAIYYIDVDEIIEETYSVRRAEESKKNPLYVHLDRLTK